MIERQTLAGFNVIVMTEEQSNSKAVLCPERGGILIQLALRGKEILYLQEETFSDITKNIRGGNPVLFPICGPLPDNEYVLDGNTYSMKQHGFARNKPWKVEAMEANKVTLLLEDDEETREQYPFEFCLRFTYELKDGQLLIHQQYENRSQRVMPFYAGFHPYFKGNHSKSKYNIPSSQFFDYSDNETKKRTGATADLDIRDTKVFLRLSDSTSSIQNERYTLHVSYSQHFKHALLWSERPEEYICLEPWMAEAGSLTNKEDIIQLEPGKTLEAECSYSIE
ncbi:MULTISPECIES: aldose epimerase family protein [Bacillus]|uniref:aldose epimerase family protein n=1 Tax=Bacillus TaxID=1386 RepID=UPI0003071EF3|nr:MULTISPECIES: hypothetical protein [Bacillus]